jgi:hypothetical protein
MKKLFLKRFLLLFFGLLTCVVGIFAWMLLSQAFQSELSYRRHVSFMNFEQAGYRLRDALARDYSGIDSQNSGGSPVGFLRFKEKPEILVGPVAAELVRLVKTDLSQQAFMLAGKYYLVRRWESGEGFFFAGQNFGPGIYGIVWQLKPEAFRLVDIPFSGQAWILNHQSQLVMSSDPQAKVAELLRLPLVQSFIQAPVQRFQIPMESEDKYGDFGFAMQIPDTNLILFAQLPLSPWVSPILKNLGRASALLLIGLLFLAILTRSYVLGLREQVLSMAKILENFAGGYFIPPEMSEIQVFKELEPIHSAVIYSTKRVRQRLNELEKEAQAGEKS